MRVVGQFNFSYLYGDASAFVARELANNGIHGTVISIDYFNPRTVTLDVNSPANASIVRQAFLNMQSVYPDIVSNVGNFSQADTVIGSGSIGGNVGGGIGIQSGGTYTVVSGDTFNAIARRFGLTSAQLQALNPQVTNINVIHVGQILRVSGNATLGQSGNNNPVSTIPVATNVNPNTGQTTVVQAPVAPPAPKEKNWFDRTFFDGAGALTGVGIGVLVVLGVVVITQRQQ